ncbi:hypothetical protein [Okeania sp.]|uniref:hypothetical protein n=1 Tax=Okeania sp. TaxID=3100323 RepID=UPI002B4B416F|nr:hypothetical protein [Okeania sp.]MEB3340240.1 hypothetical protein [Okeania sp.]
MNLQNTCTTNKQTTYDIVGKYNQDRINGFDEDFLQSFVKLLNLENAENVLDAMGGNGNLTHRMVDYCLRQNINLPGITLLEYSSVQTDLARSYIDVDGVNIINGDVLSMRDIQSGEKLPINCFDRVVIKSGTHEISAQKQHQLYTNLFQALKPSGMFINPGFLFDDIQERDEFREITRVKDSLIGAMDAVANRHFLMRQEFYQFLQDAGFKNVEGKISFEYLISSEVVDREYLSPRKLEGAIAKILDAQTQAIVLQQHGRILFDGNKSIMRLPGEITVALKS